jgi:hypothetical protein
LFCFSSFFLPSHRDIDRHKIRYWAGECNFDDMRFEIMAHTLRVYRPKGNCPGRYQPQLDFSRAAAPWRYSFTDISIPSQHTITGRRFDAEVIISHAYSVKKDGKLVSIPE